MILIGLVFEIGNIEADNAFKELLDQVKDEMEIKIDIANAGDHVPQAKRNIRTIKGRICACVGRMPYTYLPKNLVAECAVHCTNQLNWFPNENSCSRELSPHNIVKQEEIDFHLHGQFPFGAYCVVHYEPNPYNTEEARALDWFGLVWNGLVWFGLV